MSGSEFHEPKPCPNPLTPSPKPSTLTIPHMFSYYSPHVLLLFPTCSPRGLAELVVIDAKTMSSEPVARVMMPCRVPYGFHATWVNEEQMQKQQH